MTDEEYQEMYDARALRFYQQEDRRNVLRVIGNALIVVVYVVGFAVAIFGAFMLLGAAHRALHAFL